MICGLFTIIIAELAGGMSHTQSHSHWLGEHHICNTKLTHPLTSKGGEAPVPSTLWCSSAGPHACAGCKEALWPVGPLACSSETCPVSTKDLGLGCQVAARHHGPRAPHQKSCLLWTRIASRISSLGSTEKEQRSSEPLSEMLVLRAHATSGFHQTHLQRPAGCPSEQTLDVASLRAAVYWLEDQAPCWET